MCIWNSQCSFLNIMLTALHGRVHGQTSINTQPEFKVLASVLGDGFQTYLELEQIRVLTQKLINRS